MMEDAVENMALFRRFVLNIVKQSNCGARSQRNKLKEPAGMTTIGLSYSLVKISTKCAPALGPPDPACEQFLPAATGWP